MKSSIRQKYKNKLNKENQNEHKDKVKKYYI